MIDKLDEMIVLLRKITNSFGSDNNECSEECNVLEEIEEAYNLLSGTPYQRTLNKLLMSLLRMSEKLNLEHEKATSNHDKFRILFDMIPEPVVITEIETHVIEEFNEAFASISGIPLENADEALKGKLLFQENSLIKATIIANLNDTGNSIDVEGPMKATNGAIYTCLVSSRLVKFEKKTHILHILKDISFRKEYESEILRQSNTDKLTKLYNRHKFENLLDLYVAHAESTETTFSIILIDIDYFKNINDTRGHAIGDIVLSEVGAIIANFSKDQFEVGRWGGEEFIMLTKNFSLPQVMEVLNQLRVQIQNTLFAETISITISGGVAEYQPEQDSIKSVINSADIALYRAKMQGRNQICN